MNGPIEKGKAKFDCNAFLKRKNLTRKNLASMLGLNESAVGNWCAGISTPNYSTIVELIRIGAVAGELFGKNLAEILKGNELEASGNVGPGLFEDRVVKVVLGMKEKGMI